MIFCLLAKPMEIEKYAYMNPCDSEWTFKINEVVLYEQLTGNDEISFELDEKNKILLGFTIKIYNKNDFDAWWEVSRKAKNLTNLLSVIFGEFITSRADSTKVKTPIGNSKSVTMDMSNPNKPYQKLTLDLSSEKIQNLFDDENKLEVLYHLGNALHGSYKNPDSAIRELVLAYGDVDNLPDEFKHFRPLRNALSHKEVYELVKEQLQKDHKGLEFDGGKLDRLSSKNRTHFIMENFNFLHSALDEFRKKFGLETEKRERNSVKL